MIYLLSAQEWSLLLPNCLQRWRCSVYWAMYREWWWSRPFLGWPRSLGLGGCWCMSDQHTFFIAIFDSIKGVKKICISFSIFFFLFWSVTVLLILNGTNPRILQQTPLQKAIQLPTFGRFTISTRNRSLSYTISRDTIRRMTSGRIGRGKSWCRLQASKRVMNGENRPRRSLTPSNDHFIILFMKLSRDFTSSKLLSSQLVAE